MREGKTERAFEEALERRLLRREEIEEERDSPRGERGNGGRGDRGRER